MMSSQASVERTAAERERDADQDGGATLPKDDVFHLLQNGRRRAVLRYLAAHEGERFVMRDVAEAVAAWENDTTLQQLTSAERQRVYISLYQSHLPKLAEHGVIDYDQDRGTIEPTRLTQVLEPYLGDGLDASQTLTAGEEAAADERSDGLLSRFGFGSQ